MQQAADNQIASQPCAVTGTDPDTDQKTRQQELQRWWATSLYNTSDETWAIPFEPIADYAAHVLTDWRFAEKALDSLAERLHTCKARCPSQFRQWCYTQIDKVASAFAPQNWGEKTQRKDTKPLRFEQHGDRCFIPLRDSKGDQHLWKIPADFLEEVRHIWPVHIRRNVDGRPYVSRKVPILNPDGTRSQKNVAIHRLFLGLSAVRHEVADNLEVETRDGSWLNYCDGNLYLRAATDLLDHATVPLALAEYSKKQDKWYRPWHDARVNAWLHPSLGKLTGEILEERFQELEESFQEF